MVDTCGLVKSVVESCGEIWNRCYSSKEVRRMRDLHIEALVKQYGELGELDDCELVKKYRQSGRTLADPVEDVACSDEKTREIQTMFQTCSHSTATSVYQTIQDITSVKINKTDFWYRSNDMYDLTYRNRKLTFVTSIDVGGTFNSTVSSIIEISVLAFYV